MELSLKLPLPVITPNEQRESIMEISGDKYKSDENRAGSFFSLSQIVRDLVRWLIGIFTLTEEDRSKAGIYLGGEGRD
jgi:hypothetical protein